MTITCEVCGRPLGGIVCASCGQVSNTAYSCSHCGFAFARTVCADCGQSFARHYSGPSQSSEMGEVCRNVAIILPISLIALFALLILLGGI